MKKKFFIVLSNFKTIKMYLCCIAKDKEDKSEITNYSFIYKIEVIATNKLKIVDIIYESLQYLENANFTFSYCKGKDRVKELQVDTILKLKEDFDMNKPLNIYRFHTKSCGPWYDCLVGVREYFIHEDYNLYCCEELKCVKKAPITKTDKMAFQILEFKVWETCCSAHTAVVLENILSFDSKNDVYSFFESKFDLKEQFDAYIEKFNKMFEDNFNKGLVDDISSGSGCKKCVTLFIYGKVEEIKTINIIATEAFEKISGC